MGKTRKKLAREQSKRPHIYEIDPLRACTAFSVVGVHVLAATLFLNQAAPGVQIQNALIVALHYTREMFIFITAFALAYVYFERSFSLKQFWLKRGLGVLLPYVIWSLIYIWANHPGISGEKFLQLSLIDIPTGNASYQLYYILLSLEFYALLPLFLLFLKRCKHHPWIVLSVSFVLQLLIYYADFHTLQQNTPTSGFWYEFEQYQDRFILIYQFYFVLGGFVALYFQQVRSFLLRHGTIVAGGFFLALATLWLHFVVQIDVYHESIPYASSVLQPIMAFFCVAIILFMLWLTSRWASRTGPVEHPRGYRIWQVLADASFGVYLIHVLILDQVFRWAVPAMPKTWFVGVRVFLVWLLTAGGATAITILLLNIPIASRLVGHEDLRRSSITKRQEHPREKIAPATEKGEVSEHQRLSRTIVTRSLNTP